MNIPEKDRKAIGYFEFDVTFIAPTQTEYGFFRKGDKLTVSDVRGNDDRMCDLILLDDIRVKNVPSGAFTVTERK